MGKLKQKGFTLLELMLVVTIIAGIVLFAAAEQRRQVQAKSILTTSAQMQTWLQAITNYVVINRRWPTALKDLTSNGLILESEQCSIWPGGGNKQCPTKSLFQLSCPDAACVPNAHYMGIEIDMPNEKLAQQLALVVPASSIINKTTVQAFVPTPAVLSSELTFSKKKWGYLTAGGVVKGKGPGCHNMQRIHMPKCRPGYEGHYILFPLRQRTGRADYVGNPFEDDCSSSSLDDHHYIELYYTDTEDLLGKEPSLSVVTDLDDGKKNHKFLYYLTFCLPDNQWYPQGGHFSEARQCNSDWVSYNTTSDNLCGVAESGIDMR